MQTNDDVFLHFGVHVERGYAGLATQLNARKDPFAVVRVTSDVQGIVDVGLVTQRRHTVDPRAELDAAVLGVEREHRYANSAGGLQFHRAGPVDDSVVFDEHVGAFQEAGGHIIGAEKENVEKIKDEESNTDVVTLWRREFAEGIMQKNEEKVE